MKKKSEEDENSFEQLLDRIQRNKGIKLRSVWYVLEIEPSRRYSYGDGHGGKEYDWSKPKVIDASNYFNSEKEAVKFMDEHKPGEGNILNINQKSLYRRTVDEWFDGD